MWGADIKLKGINYIRVTYKISVLHHLIVTCYVGKFRRKNQDINLNCSNELCNNYYDDKIV